MCPSRLASTLLKGEDANQSQAKAHVEGENQLSLWLVYSQKPGLWGRALGKGRAPQAGTLIPSAQRLVWAAKQPLGKAALGALFA